MPDEIEHETADSLPAAGEDSVSPESQPGEEGVSEATPASDSDSKKDAEGDTSAQDEEAMRKEISEALKDSRESEEGETENSDPESKDKEAKPEDTGEEKKDGAEDDQDEDLTKMPEGLKPVAQERFQQLANRNRELESSVSQMEGKIQAFQQSFQEAGLDREQFQHMMNYAALANKGDYQGALKVLRDEMRTIMIHSGQAEMPDLELLKDFPDLQQNVGDFNMTMEAALEVARSRLQAQTFQQQQSAQEQQQVQRQQFDDAVTESSKTIEEMEAHFKKTDLDYEVKAATILSKSNELFSRYHPSEWPGVFKSAYDLLTKQMESSTRPVDNNSPLEPRSKEAGTFKVEDHETMADAIHAGLNSFK